MIPVEILQAVVIAVGNFAGILIGYQLLERKLERKASKYWAKVRASKEGNDFFSLIEESSKFLKSKEMKDLLEELRAGLTELHAVLKQLREKAEASQAEEDEGKPLLPSLE